MPLSSWYSPLCGLRSANRAMRLSISSGLTDIVFMFHLLGQIGSNGTGRADAGTTG
jgi:hypothetical protein